jgi:uncharacterized membrane protein
MKLFRVIHNQGLATPVSALIAASGICTALVAHRIIAGSPVRHAYLVWNLVLAWLPLWFAVLAVERFEIANSLRDRKFLVLGTAWLLFFPNAPYIFTDLVHVFSTWGQSFWVELMLILLCAMTGFLSGVLSLQVMHGLVARLRGPAAGWVFVMVVCGLAGFGVYLGRFTRLNSWDVLWNPMRLAHRISLGAWNIATQWQHAKFLILFSLFLMLAYVMLHALTQQRHVTAGAYDKRG